jgi:hypothetical protein
MVSDYFLVPVIPILAVGFGLLQSVLGPLSSFKVESSSTQDFQPPEHAGTTPRRFIVAVDFLWIVIYCVKFCFLTQFKFYKPPYAYVNVHLTRYYWAVIGICGVGFLGTVVAEPIALHYFNYHNHMSWEIAITVSDIVTDILG